MIKFEYLVKHMKHNIYVHKNKQQCNYKSSHDMMNS